MIEIVTSVIAERLAGARVTILMLQLLGDELRVRRAGRSWMFGIEPRPVAALERSTLFRDHPRLGCSRRLVEERHDDATAILRRLSPSGLKS